MTRNEPKTHCITCGKLTPFYLPNGAIPTWKDRYLCPDCIDERNANRPARVSDLTRK